MSLKLLQENLSLKSGCNILVNEGKWSAHDLLSYLLVLYPDSNLITSSYSVGEDAIRKFFDVRLKSVKIILDKSMQKHRIALLEFIQRSNCEVYLCDNHSKVLVLENEYHKVAFVGSQNYTKNRRVEVGVLFIDCEEVDVLKNGLEIIMSKSFRL